MVIITLLIVGIFLWLVFHLPITREQPPDTYEFFLQKRDEQKKKTYQTKD